MKSRRKNASPHRFGRNNVSRLSWPAIERLVSSTFPDVDGISTSDLRKALDTTEQSLILLDARSSEEYAVSHIPTARLYRPEMCSDEETLTRDPETPIVVYCSVGYRSARVVRQLQRAGYQSVFNLEGSIFAWANEGHQLVRDGHPVSVVHPYNRAWGVLLRRSLHASGTP